MLLLRSNNGVQTALTATVYLMGVLSTCSTKDCGLQLTEKIKKRSVIFRNVDMKLCQTECTEDSFIVGSCHRSRDEVDKIEKTEGSHVLNHRIEAETEAWRSKVCNVSSPCLKAGCGVACVGTPFSCELHSAAKTGNLSRMKLILSQRRLDINCKDCIGRTPVMWAAAEGHREMVQFLVSSGANISLVDRFDINIFHLACLRGHVEVMKYLLSQTMLDVNSRVQFDRTAVMLAAENGHKDVVELLVDRGVDLSLVDETGDNVLHYACRGGDVEVVKYILSKNRVDIDRRGSRKMTPIMVARHYGHREVIELLVSKRADGSLKYYNHKTMLHDACQKGNMEVVKYVLSQNIVDVNSRGGKKMTAVMIAAEAGNKDMVQVLVENGANLSLVNANGGNILHVSCKGGHIEVVKYVLSRSIVDINSVGWKKKTPVMVAAERGYKDLVEVLAENGANLSFAYRNSNNILHWACKGGNIGVVKYVLSQNVVDINSRGEKKMTAVMVAAESGHKELVGVLVENGANLSLTSKNSYNILHWACKGGHVEVVKYVLSQNIVDINSRGWKKMTAVMVAAESGHKDLVGVLVENGANLSLTSKNSFNILHWACKGGHIGVVKYVLSQNIVDINSRGWKKMTPVMVAAEWGYKDLVEILVEKGANLLLSYKNGSNILHLACKGGHIKVIEYVLSQNIVDINKRGMQDMTPIMVAAKYRHKDVVELLANRGADVSDVPGF